MAGKKRKKSKKKNPELPAWAWMFFGLAIGLSVAGAIYVNDRTPVRTPRPVADEPASMSAAVESAVDMNGEPETAEEEEPRFTFYNMLPNFEVVIAESESDVTTDKEPQPIVEPGVYVLQAGSFSAYADADRRRATLAMQGIESRIQRVTIDDKTYHRVRIGPLDDLDELNVLRSRLRSANIDVLRIRLGD
jgi:cell division protein FtsN